MPPFAPSVVVCLVGLVVYSISTNPKAAELSRLCFACGLLAALLSLPR